MKKIVFLITIIAVLLIATTVMADEGIPMVLINKLDEIKTAIEGLTLSSEVNVYPNYTPDVNVESPIVNVENTVPVPNVTVNNVISDGKECEWEKRVERIVDTKSISGISDDSWGIGERKCGEVQMYIFPIHYDIDWGELKTTEIILDYFHGRDDSNYGQWDVEIWHGTSPDELELIQTVNVNRDTKIPMFSLNSTFFQGGVNYWRVCTTYRGPESTKLIFYTSLVNFNVEYQIKPANC